MKRMVCVLLMLIVAALMAGCTSGPLSQATPSPTPRPLAASEDPVVGTYDADVNDNRLNFNPDNTFSLETPALRYVGIWQKVDNSHYTLMYTDPRTGKHVERTLIYDANDKSLSFEGEPTVDYVKI
ncbi:hypothetical protein [Methanocella sp. MCL-LM]|uniref:hypothetical protein n=1 Tax=Methanocella sp. MCL-LM TaxID=3412035 RepID=UPI003C7741D1